MMWWFWINKIVVFVYVMYNSNREEKWYIKFSRLWIVIKLKIVNLKFFKKIFIFI